MISIAEENRETCKIVWRQSYKQLLQFNTAQKKLKTFLILYFCVVKFSFLTQKIKLDKMK